MTKEENIKAILECNFVGFREEIINIATKMICELEQKWIPVTERLPEKESNTYWVCTHNGCQCECRWTNVNPFWSYETTDWHWNIADIPQYTKVVAWMPLPQPYKAESEGE